MDRKNPLHVTAIHEAGHAIAYYHLQPRRKIKRVTIESQNDSLGHVEHEGLISKSTLKKLVGGGDLSVKILSMCYQVLMSGPFAEAIFTGSFDEAEADGDLYTISDYLLSKFSDVGKQEAFILRLERKTNDLLNTNWELIENIAQILLERKTLSGDEFYQIMRDYARSNKKGLK